MGHLLVFLALWSKYQQISFHVGVSTTVNSNCVAGKAAAAAPGPSPFITLSPHTAARCCLGLTDHPLRMYLSCLLDLQFLAWPFRPEPEPPPPSALPVLFMCIPVKKAAQANRRDVLTKGKVGGKLSIRTIRIFLTWDIVIQNIKSMCAINWRLEQNETKFCLTSSYTQSWWLVKQCPPYGNVTTYPFRSPSLAQAHCLFDNDKLPVALCKALVRDWLTPTLTGQWFLSRKKSRMAMPLIFLWLNSFY